VGAILSNEISKIYGAQGLPEDTILVDFEGSVDKVLALPLMDCHLKFMEIVMII
jgi:glutamate synthase domain-containing protein 3